MTIAPTDAAVEQRERAVKMVLDQLDEHRSVYAACQTIGPKVGMGAESLRRCVLQAQVDGAQRPGATTAEQQRIKDLERENRDLKEANEILKAASIFFARELGYGLDASSTKGTHDDVYTDSLD